MLFSHIGALKDEIQELKSQLLSFQPVQEHVSVDISGRFSSVHLEIMDG